jgi:hypothetical protein
MKKIEEIETINENPLDIYGVLCNLDIFVGKNDTKENAVYITNDSNDYYISRINSWEEMDTLIETLKSAARQAFNYKIDRNNMTCKDFNSLDAEEKGKILEKEAEEAVDYYNDKENIV